MKDEMVVRYRFWHLGWTDEREEQWLRAQARAGLHLVRAQSAIGRYVFRRAAPQDMVFSVEYQGACRAAAGGGTGQGWEQVPGRCGWSYWRKPAAALAPGEVHIAPRERAARLRRLLGVLVACGMPMFTNAVLFRQNLFDPQKFSSMTHVLGFAFVATVALCWSVSVFRLARRVHHYQRSAA